MKVLAASDDDRLGRHVSTLPERYRISLRGLLLVPLILSPAFFAIPACFEIAARRLPPSYLLWAFVSGAVYSSILLAFWNRRRKRLGMQDRKRAFRSCLVFGTLTGALFGALFFIPCETTSVVVTAKRHYSALKNFETFPMILFGGVFVTLNVLVLFSLIGAAVGGLFGLFVSHSESSVGNTR